MSNVYELIASNIAAFKQNKVVRVEESLKYQGGIEAMQLLESQLKELEAATPPGYVAEPAPKARKRKTRD